MAPLNKDFKLSDIYMYLVTFAFYHYYWPCKEAKPIIWITIKSRIALIPKYALYMAHWHLAMLFGRRRTCKMLATRTTFRTKSWRQKTDKLTFDQKKLKLTCSLVIFQVYLLWMRKSASESLHQIRTWRLHRSRPKTPWSCPPAI